MNPNLHIPANDETISSAIQELERAMRAHLAWVGEWHRCLLCGLPFHERPSDDGSERQCELGRWYRRHLGSVLDDRQDFRAIDPPHAELHSRALALAGAARRGEEITPEEYGRFQERERQLDEILHRLRDGLRDALAARDPLTRTLNRESFELVVTRELARAARTGEPWCLAIADLDHFKEINDTHGHQAGDRVLREVADRLTANLRTYDSLCRYGGDEFVVFFPGTGRTRSEAILDRLRERLSRAGIRASDGAEVRVTISFGLVGAPRGMSLDEAVARADEALYAAKRDGRNRVHVWRDEDRDRESGTLCYNLPSHEYGDR